MMMRQTETSVSCFLYAGVLAVFFYFFWELSRLFPVMRVAFDPGFQIFTDSSITEIVDCGTSSDQVGQVTDE